MIQLRESTMAIKAKIREEVRGIIGRGNTHVKAGIWMMKGSGNWGQILDGLRERFGEPTHLVWGDYDRYEWVIHRSGKSSILSLASTTDGWEVRLSKR